MKLTVVFSIHNQFPLARVAIQHAIDNLSEGSDTELIIVDNGSDENFVQQFLPTSRQVNVRYQDNIGVYPLFWIGLHATSADVIAFFHSDLIITEKDWDTRVLEQFANNPRLGLLGFIGSNQIDKSGGRGLGTTSNFQGGMYVGLPEHHNWTGPPAEIHGKRDAGYSRAAVVDGCAMIFRRSVLEQIKQRPDFPPHHFYDRLISCEVRELRYDIGVLGVACDHISGQTVNQEVGYKVLAAEWLTAHKIYADLGQEDHVLYKEAERQWLSEYRDEKHLVPYFVDV